MLDIRVYFNIFIFFFFQFLLLHYFFFPPAFHRRLTCMRYVQHRRIYEVFVFSFSIFEYTFVCAVDGYFSFFLLLFYEFLTMEFMHTRRRYRCHRQCYCSHTKSRNLLASSSFLFSFCTLLRLLFFRLWPTASLHHTLHAEQPERTCSALWASTSISIHIFCASFRPRRAFTCCVCQLVWLGAV